MLTQRSKYRKLDSNGKEMCEPNTYKPLMLFLTNPLNRKFAELYDEWLANGFYKFTVSGNMNPAPQRLFIDMVASSSKKS